VNIMESSLTAEVSLFHPGFYVEHVHKIVPLCTSRGGFHIDR
jgi:hypothetical protein